MRTKPFSTLTTALVAMTLWIAAGAQTPKAKMTDAHPPTGSKPPATIVHPPGDLLGTQVKLPCKGIRGGDVASFIRVTNNTGSAIPQLTVIYFSTNNGSGKQALNSALSKGGSKNLNAPPGGAPTSCEAWFFKK